jgi:hypothetical protein
MTKFDKLCEEFTRKRGRSRYPKDIALSREFIDSLEHEYFIANDTGNRNFHSNFLKAITYKLNEFKDNKVLASRYHTAIADPDKKVSVYDIGGDIDDVSLGDEPTL